MDAKRLFRRVCYAGEPRARGPPGPSAASTAQPVFVPGAPVAERSVRTLMMSPACDTADARDCIGRAHTPDSLPRSSAVIHAI